MAVAARDLDGIVVGDGPGSFTGLRVGWSVAKGLAQEAGLQFVAVPSLMAAAAGAAVRLGAVPIAACFDALRGDVYGAVYVVHPDRVETVVAPATTTVAELMRTSPCGSGTGGRGRCDALRGRRDGVVGNSAGASGEPAAARDLVAVPLHARRRGADHRRHVGRRARVRPAGRGAGQMGGASRTPATRSVPLRAR